MFNVGGGEILVILLLALLVLGPDKLPEAARKVGKVVNDFRRLTQGFQDEMSKAMDVSGSNPLNAETSPGPRLVGPPTDPTASPTPPPAIGSPTPSGDAAPPTSGPAEPSEERGPDGPAATGDTSAA